MYKAYTGDYYVQFGYTLDKGFYRKLIGERVDNKRLWNKKTKRLTGSHQWCLEVNRKIDLYEKRMRDLIYDADSNGYMITERLIDINVFTESGVKTKKIDFKAFVKEVIERRSKDPGFRKNTVRKYWDLYRNILRFEESEGYEIQFQDIDTKFFNDFRLWLLNYRGNNNSTMSKYMNMLKTFLRLAYKAKMPVPEDFKDLKIQSYSAFNIYLNKDELALLYGHEYKLQSLRNAVDLFCLEAYTGLRFGDALRLNESNFVEIGGNDMIYIQQQKTGKAPIVIPLHPVVREIINKGMPDKISNQKLNMYIKEAARECGLTRNVVYYFNKAGEDVSEIVPKCDLITSHTARRSLITNMVIAEVPLHLVMKISGHKTESSLMRYLCLENEQAALLLSKHKFFS